MLASLLLLGLVLEVAPLPVYQEIFIYCIVKGHWDFQFFDMPYLEK